MRILDVHSHILPGVDDGAQNTEEAIKLLEMLKQQGVTDVIATPHFSPAEDSMEKYSRDYEEAKKALQEAMRGKDLPNVYYGCEVLYSYGFGALEGINQLAISGTKYILIEFGFLKFTDSVCKDIMKIRTERGLTPIIAHIERYKRFGAYDKLLALVEEGYCKAQINSSSVVGNVFSKNAHKLIKKGYVDFIGSDCHSVDARPPRIDEAYRVISQKFGNSYAAQYIKNGEKLICELIGKTEL